MSKTLALKIGEQQFPNNSNPIVLSSYKYSAKRMGNAPVISATVDYPECLDNLWSDDVYVEFRGEKYYLKQTPSSSYDNSKITYKHTIELVSERIVLENVYFFDVVRENTENDKPVSNSSEFSFAGDVKQFAERFNYSAKWSGLDYTVVVDEDVILEDKHIQFQDQFLYNALQNIYEVYKTPFYFVGKVIHIGYAENILPTVLKYGIEDSLLSISRNNTNNAIYNRITGRGSDRNITYYYPNPTPKGYVSIETNTSGATIEIDDLLTFANMIPIEANVSYIVGKDLTPDKYITLYNNGSLGEETAYNKEGVYFGPSRHGNRFFVPFFQKEASSVSLSISYDVTRGSVSSVNSSSYVKTAKLTSLTESASYHPVITGKWNVSYSGEVPAGAYCLELDVWLYTTAGSSVNATIVAHDNKYNYWKIDGDNKEYSPSELGVSITGTPTAGDSFSLKVDKRVNVQNNLMPSIYRNTSGEERFYNAENGVYKDEDGNDIVFSNLYSDTRPREYIYQGEDIYPTIEKMVNANGFRIDMFSEFAFDEHDNDEVYPVGHEREGNYVHPYFFGKLRKFDGEHGFNLFDHAIEGQPMTISMTSGRCSACEFTIGVDEKTSSYNTVQVTEIDSITLNGTIPAGTLKRDEDGNVLCGRWPQAPQPKQERQNDTVNYEVWVALKKEDQTFGVLMPSQDRQYLPEAGDSFVILNINLPEAYVLAAEDRLEKAAIEYMADNNGYKFNYSAKFSKIFFEQNPDVSDILNENSKVKVQYNGIDEELYVASYSYNMTDSEPLPEVTIELNDEIKIVKGAFDRIKTDIKYTLGPTINNIGLQLAGTKNTINNVSRTANEANNIAAQALSAGEELKADISEVSVIASDAKLSASLAQSDANQAKEGVSAVGNEVGSLKTTITATQITANKAQAAADNALSEVGKVSEDSNSKFEIVNTSITNINKDVDALESLIGDEYNIWFESETQIGSEPTLNNYPASDWTSDDDYFNHDKDLYYSITLGRAWRFMYNEGSPYWEEITDSDTITALTKAQEALDKAQEALDEANSVSYIKGIFGEDNVLDEKAAILGKLVAVKNEADDIVAGLYGGNSAELNAIGYADSEYGTLLIFAGSPSADKVSESDFKVYESGRVEIKTGVFTGLTKHKIINIDNSNVDKFFPATTGEDTSSNGTSMTRRALSPDIFTSITRFGSTFTKYSDISIHLPAIYNFNLKDDLGEFTRDELRELAGNTFYIYNNSSAFIHLCGYSYSEDSSTLIGPVCFADGIIDKGEFAKVTCVLDVISGKEILYWKYTIGRTSPIILNPTNE